MCIRLKLCIVLSNCVYELEVECTGLKLCVLVLKLSIGFKLCVSVGSPEANAILLKP